MAIGETIGLIEALKGNGGGSSLPAVTSSDNGKVLAVKDGAWAADENTIILPITSGKVELTGAEINALVEAGKTVMLAGTNEYDVYVGKYYDAAYFANMRSINIVYRSVGSNKNVITTNTVPLPPASASDNGKELIVINGAWAKQQKKFIVTLTPTAQDFSGTMDKTVAEINEAYEAGIEIWFRVYAGTSYSDVPLARYGNADGSPYPSFNANFLYDEVGVLVLIYTGTTDDGTKQTYNTKVYALTPAS